MAFIMDYDQVNNDMLISLFIIPGAFEHLLRKCKILHQTSAFGMKQAPTDPICFEILSDLQNINIEMGDYDIGDLPGK